MSDISTQIAIREHLHYCEASLYDASDFEGWLAQHDAEVVLAERRRVLAEVRSVAPDGGFVADIVELTLEKEDKGGKE